MKNAFVSACSVILGIIWAPKRTLLRLGTLLCALVILAWGCSSYEQPGETEAQGRIRHQRNLRISQQQLMADIDRAMLLDKPSKLSDKRIP